YDLIALLLLARISAPSHTTYKKKGLSFLRFFLSVEDCVFFKKFLNCFLTLNVSKHFNLAGKFGLKIANHQLFVSSLSLKHFLL
ncbi:hypothetical protein, partial [Vibrio sp. V42_P2S4T144]|uniref:hypothetical protein n=1 Tax=Vibrio sp. V42_P2S4T144 TaxID=1938693 RepID=UPI001F204A1C